MDTGNAPNAIFQLKGFSVPRFHFDSLGGDFTSLDINLAPSGMYNTSNGEFRIGVAAVIKGINKNNPEISTDFIDIAMRADFLIEGKPSFDNIPDFFYQNSLAIVFPYLRAFISNMTLQAGLPLLVLPLLNLTHLSTELKEKTEVFE